MPVAKLRGLPWSVTSDDIKIFFDGVKIAKKRDNVNENNVENVSNSELIPEENNQAIYIMTNYDGRPSGEAFVEFENEDDLEMAIKKNNALMGHRYIEVFRSNFEQLNKHLEESKNNASNWTDPVVRLRGLPYGCTKPEIINFFDGLNVAYDGIMMVIDFTGRFNGEAFVQFENNFDAKKALDFHKKKILNRYIEVFRSTFDEMTYYSNNSNMIRLNKNASKFFQSDEDFNNSKFSSRSNSVNSYYDTYNRTNRPKPYSRNNPTYGRINKQSNYQQFNSNINANDDSTDNRYSSYICENNHRHYLNMNNNTLNNNYSIYSKKKCEYNQQLNINYQIQRTDYRLKMRGLPFSVTENEIREFFAPITPVNVIILCGKDQRPSGECECDFNTYNEACEAMKYDKKFIGNRYIELFLISGSNGSFQKSQTPLSIGSLMKKDFISNKSNNNMNSDSNFNQYQTDLNLLEQQNNKFYKNNNQISTSTSSAFATNINDLIIPDINQKMHFNFNAYNRYQSQNSGFGSSMNIKMPNFNMRQF